MSSAPPASMQPEGRLCVADGLEWYRVDDYDLLDPFLVNVTSRSDLWLFVSSTGALTAGRRSPEQALFAYETDDRLHRSGGRTGPFTLIRTGGGDEPWQPFAPHAPYGTVRRSVAKTLCGDRLRFEEHNPELGLTFRYTWATAAGYGLVRTCELAAAAGASGCDIELLDGLIDVLPAGVELEAQQTSSTLVDAYRRSEFDPESGLALFTLEALVSDLSDPAESLLASVVWSRGLDAAVTAMSDRQIRSFRSGKALEAEHLATGVKGAFLVSAPARVGPDSPLRWTIVADVNRDHIAVARLRRWLRSAGAAESNARAAVDQSHGDLTSLIAHADALQQTADRGATVRHLANVTYNCMRGGVPLDAHRVGLADVSRFMSARNRPAAARFEQLAAGMDAVVELDELQAAVSQDATLARLANEYLPLTFSRRHGDPSRPWNSFQIGDGASTGDRLFAYEGNWRDIFQNWLALVHSFPGYAPSFLAKFLNASTLDGHNPYRIGSDGIDWEMPGEGSWSTFGYWGDHQIVYLHSILDAVHRFHPGSLEAALDRLEFSYGDVPYRMLPYDSIVADPKHTLEFDHAAQDGIDDRVTEIGADGRLVAAAGGGVHHASLAEKLLVPALAKLSSLVPGGGIWLNTQRPEWNDANNALVGIGVSVVTVFHLREYLAFLDGLLERSPVGEVPVAPAVLEWMAGLESAFDTHRGLAEGDPITAEARRDLLDQLGRSASSYRSSVYGRPPEPARAASVAAVRGCIRAALPHLDRIIAEARRSDGLAHAYRLLRLGPATAELDPLYVMLEGQIAALSSALAGPQDVIDLVDALFASDLYRPDQRSFLLYPNTPRPSFMNKNQVPESAVGPALRSLIDDGHGIAQRDADGSVRFAAHLRRQEDLEDAIDSLEEACRPDSAGRAEVLEAYEAVFEHRAFAGRSQTMYRYEGLGCVYWHMVMKLMFRLQQRIFAAADSDADRDLLAEMVHRYRRVRAGLGPSKTVVDHGAFPLDPHSHTPAHTGAQQPGMTGAVKEGILLRWGELGLRVDDGRLGFAPVLLDPAEFLAAACPWPPLGEGGSLEPGTLGFTYCGAPVVYHQDDSAPWTRATLLGGETVAGTDRLDRAVSRALFARTGAVSRIDVGIDPAQLFPQEGAALV
ncbi:MAG: hypothetical protein F4011_07090 [Acidimicrobiaceae bacterium]|nr:hypothetical protein [Acidimicrobiaceae bacterium]MYL03933.1 hypothetical protein [Acidimicrobiaceae bacterium]